MYAAVWLPFAMLLILYGKRKKYTRQSLAARIHRKKKGESIMEAVAQKYMGKGVSVTTVNESHVGILTRYHDGWITLTYKYKDLDHHCDYIVKMQSHPLPREKHVAE